MATPIKDKITDAECSMKCRSSEDAAKLINVVSKSSDEATLIYLATNGICNNPGRVVDAQGRLVIHLAASIGKRLVCEWLLRFKGAAINTRDIESGYTPLHRSILHGHVDVAKFLIDSGANPFLNDNEYLSPLELHVKDRKCFNSLSTQSDLCEVYLWGANNNFNLGLGHQEQRTQPEVLDQFRKEETFCRDIKLQKFHSAFLTSDGRIFTCGHGQGGRLGQGSEDSLLKPSQINFPVQEMTFSAIALGVDHSIFLSNKGTLWTCGSNFYHQLGISPPPKYLLSPTQISAGKIKLPPATGISAARFHSLFWNRDVIYTWGLNAGQLGHGKTDEKTIISPKPLVFFLDKKVRDVLTSDGAIIVLTENYDIYALQEFTAKRILSVKYLKISKMAITGGRLCSKVIPNSNLVEGGGEDLKIFILSENGKIYIWQDGRQQTHPEGCLFIGSRDLWISDFAIGRSSSIMIVTNEGLGFELSHFARTKQSNPKSITCDPKGNNFGVLQVSPKAEMTDLPEVMKSEMVENFQLLYEETDEMDALHDLEISVRGKTFFCHKFIIANLCEKISKLVQTCDGKLDLGDQMEPEIFEELLKFAYTRRCDLMKTGPTDFTFKNLEPLQLDDSQSGIVSTENPATISAFQFYEERKKGNNKVVKKSRKNTEKPGLATKLNPINMLIEAAKQFSITNLVTKLSVLKYANGAIEIVSSKGTDCYKPSPLKFSRKSFPEFYDVKITSEDGIEFSAHRCVLAARLEYFRTMFQSGRWIESQRGYSLKLPVPGRLLSVLLDYIYTDDINLKKGTNDEPEFFCSLIVMADQFLVPRLIQICERHLSGLVNLKNVGDILQFSDSFHASQLKNSCLQFVAQNLAPILEAKGLDMVSWDCLRDAAKYYRNTFRNVEGRQITPFDGKPSTAELDEYFMKVDVSPEDLFDYEAEELNSKQSTPLSSGKKKNLPGRTRKASNDSLGSLTSDSEDDSKKEEKTFDLNLDQLEIEEKSEMLKKENILSKEESKFAEKKISSFFAGPNHDVVPPVRRPPCVDQKRFTKPSQKERKRLSSFSQLSLKDDEDVLSQQIQSQSTPPKWSGWYKSNPQESSVDLSSPSLSLIIQTEKQKISTPLEITSGKKQPMIPKRTAWKQLNLGDESPTAPTVNSPPKNPWKVVQNDDVSHDRQHGNSNSFKTILAEEIEQSENLTRAQTKSLRITQIEEEAIEDLKLFYNVDKVFDEIITVTRADEERKLAAPIWRRNTPKK